MARNRRSKSAAVRFGPALKAVLLFLLMAGAGVGYIWQKNQINSLASQKKLKENELERLRRQNRLNRDHLEYLRLPWVVEARVKELKLGLGPSQPEQILRLVDMGPSSPAVVTDRQYANRGSTKEVVR